MPTWILILKVCSLQGEVECMPEFINTTEFLDFYSCNLTGYADRLRLYEDLGLDEQTRTINEDMIVVNHHCERKLGEGT